MLNILKVDSSTYSVFFNVDLAMEKERARAERKKGWLEWWQRPIVVITGGPIRLMCYLHYTCVFLSSL